MTTSSRFNRSDAAAARLVVKRLLPDPKVRRRALEILRSDIERAHAIDPASWGVTLLPNRVRLNIGRGAVLSLGAGKIELKGEKPLDAAELESSWANLEKEHVTAVKWAAQAFGDDNFTNPSWRGAHSPGVLALLREEFGDVPIPSYASQHVENTTDAFDLESTLRQMSEAAALHLPFEHVATFFMALQTKSFVILSGLSGTGKTRLATAFAETLPASGGFGGGETRLEADFRATGRLILPGEAARLAVGSKANIVCNGHAFHAKIEAGNLVLRGAGRKCALENFNEGQTIGVETEIDDAGKASFRLFPRDAQAPAARNSLFVPVQADWTDAKPLLGYFNPLLSRYEWTPLLRFLLQADTGFKERDGLAYFVILDEMNLARVEHYFAPFLSVQESGRDGAGHTREPLRFEFDARTSGELPPRELYLPPNLYFIGTLNSDETTHPLSPKVLDRAWVLEAPPVDFASYGAIGQTEMLHSAQKRALLKTFTRENRFVSQDKNMVARELETEPRWRALLSELNGELQVLESGFGFRVFDEILTFVALARENGLFEPLETAFERALAAKVLSRMRGGALQVEDPLQLIRDWANRHTFAFVATETERLLKRVERQGFI